MKALDEIVEENKKADETNRTDLDKAINVLNQTNDKTYKQIASYIKANKDDFIECFED
jgi:bacterioferritin (cytochrome b1)